VPGLLPAVGADVGEIVVREGLRDQGGEGGVVLLEFLAGVDVVV
jgi:hypothetical protein